MTKTVQISKHSLLVLLTLVLLLPGCVAKKKFVEMESYRNKAELRVKQLTADVANLQQEFNAYKYDFNYSNFNKDQSIDSLNKVIVGLNSDLSSTNENIEDQTFSFQVEKRRLNQLLAERDREIRMAQRNSESLSIQLNDLKDEISALNIKLQNAESNSNARQQKVKMQEDELARITDELQKKAGEIKKLQSELTAKNEQISALQNQVKLLKSQFGQ